MGKEKVPRDLHAEVEKALASFRPGLDRLIAEHEERMRQEEQKPRQGAGDRISFSFLRRVVDQGYVYSPKSPEESAFLAVYGDLSKLRRIRNEMLALLKP